MKSQKMWGRSILFSLGFLVCGIGLAQANQTDIGKGVLGYDLKAGVKDKCIVLNQDEIGSQDVRLTEYNLVMVKTKEELFDKITSSISGEGSYYSFSAKAKFKFMKEIQWNYNSVYLWLNATRTTRKDVITRDNVLLSKATRNIMLDSKFKFAEVCGSKFITEVELGGEIFGLIEVVSDNYEEKQRLESSIQAGGDFGVGSVSGNANYERTIQKLKDKYEVKIQFRHVGGKRVNIPQTPEELINLAKNIEEITDVEPVQIKSKTREYSTVSNSIYDTNSPEILERQDIITAATIKIKEARAEFANGLYVLAHSGDFKKFNRKVLEADLNKLEEDIWSLKRLKDDAYSFQEEVDESILFNDYTLNLPAKKRRTRGRELKVTCENKRADLCGVESYKIQESAYCGVLSPKTGTGPVCGALYNQKADQVCGIKAYRSASTSACGVNKYKQCHHKSCGKKWDGSRKRCRTSGCGVESYNTCRDKSHGVEAYNSCRDESFGIEKYYTCSHKDFGYNFDSCAHFSHGPELYKECNVAEIGKKLTYCPNL